MKTATRRMVTRVEDETGDVIVTQPNTDEEYGLRELVKRYPEAAISRIEHPALADAPFIFWRVRLHG